MLEVSNIQTYGWEAAIRGMRNPMNSWGKSDSEHELLYVDDNGEEVYCADLALGSNDLDLACRLIKAGPEHAKFLRMIHVQMDINAPLYYWKEMDQYKVGTTTNSCSTMHRIAAKEFGLSDFSHEHLGYDGKKHLEETINLLNFYREKFINPDINKWNELTCKKDIWWQLIQLLPSSYNQLRTWDASLATVLSICKQRKGHKLDEWETFRQACFENIPYFTEFYNAMTGGNN